VHGLLFGLEYLSVEKARRLATLIDDRDSVIAPGFASIDKIFSKYRLLSHVVEYALQPPAMELAIAGRISLVLGNSPRR